MAFLGKLGNALQDLGSAAVPAGVMAGLTLASGGTLNPGTTGGLMSLLGTVGAGAKGFQANEQAERARKLRRRQQRAFDVAQGKNEQAVGRANLINALNPRAGAQAALTQPGQVKAPKAGMLETIAGGIGQGTDMAQTVMQLNQARELAQAQLANLNARTGLTEAQKGILDKKTSLLEQIGNATGAPPADTAPDPAAALKLGQTVQPGQEQIDIGFERTNALDPTDRQTFSQRMNVGDVDNPSFQAGVAMNQDTLDAERNERIRTAFDVSLGDIENADNVQAGIDRMNAELAISDDALSEVEATAFLKAMNSTLPDKGVEPLDLSDQQAFRVGGLVALDTQLARLERKVRSGELEDFIGTFDGGRTALQNALLQETLPPKARDFLVSLGFTAEAAVRLFSGAAVRDEEEQRFREEFIGSLRGGSANMIASINAFQRGLRDQRDGILTVARAIKAGDERALMNEDEINDLINAAENGDETAIQRLRDLGMIGN